MSRTILLKVIHCGNVFKKKWWFTALNSFNCARNIKRKQA